MKNISLPTAGLIAIKNNKLLLAFSKNKKAWYLPGGKIDRSESSLEALQREIQEELNIKLAPNRLEYYGHVSAQAYGEASNIIMKQDCFLYELNETIRPSNEIADVKYFDLKTYQLEPVQVEGVIVVFNNLIKDGIII